MSSRKKGRRHKGSHRQIRYPNGAQYLAENRAINEAWVNDQQPSEAEAAIAYWREHIGSPLFVYFIVESDKFSDSRGIHSEDEWDEFYDGFPNGAFKAVKIGKARDPMARKRELQCGNPRGLKIKHVILAAPGTERWLHKHWQTGAEIRGEWYGNRYYDAILAVAQATCRAQIEAHKAGENMHYIAELIPQDVARNKLGKEAV